MTKTCDWAEPEIISKEGFKGLPDDDKRNVIYYQTNYNEFCI
jgi:hypothetical protein